MNKETIRILGSGPSGLTAATLLAKAGKEVHVYERKSDCGARFLGDLQGLENWTTPEDVLDVFTKMGLDINFDITPYRALTLSDGENLRKDFEFDVPLFYLVKRGVQSGTLDSGLKAQALHAGVQLHFNTTIPVEQANLIATGPNTQKIFAIDKGIVFKTSLPNMAVGLVNDKAAYKGYSYLLITNSYGCICSVLFDSFDRMDECYQVTLETFKKQYTLDIRDERPVGGLGHFSLDGRFIQDGRLYLGEAAGLQDLLWGFGIRSAVRSGYLAAQSILQGHDYTQLATEEFLPRMKSSVVLRFLYEKLSRFGYGYLVNTTHSRPDVRNFLRRSHKLTWIHKVVYPVALWDLKKRWRFL